jgi:5-methylcytosine-specific restriction protein A
MKPITHAQRMKAMQPKANEMRPNSTIRGYDWSWRKLRKWKLSRVPMCEEPGCDRAATDVDHIIARAKGGGDVMDNLRSYCHSCHSRKTAREDGGFGRRPKV